MQFSHATARLSPFTIVYIISFINIIHFNKSDVKVELNIIITIILIFNILYKVIKALISEVMSLNNKFLIDGLNQFINIKETERLY